jgi:thiamine pyrophosphate-dependent acetolactate synthase large subunit-like protein
MHIQELEMVKRHGIKFMVFCLNDGAYGSEIHKLRAEHIDDTGAIFGRPDFASIARGFGLRGATVTDVKQLKGIMEEYEAGNTAMIVDVHISDRVTSPKMRSAVKAGHGVR